MANKPTFTVGIEEEYLLVDKETRGLAVDPPEELFAECEKKIPGLVKPEFLKSQIEVNTKICKTVTQARKNLALLRHTVADIVGNYGLAPIAASTHPFSEWQRQHHTDRELLQRTRQGPAGGGP